MTHLSPNWFDNVEQRPHPWPGLNWFTAMLYVPNVNQALKLYESIFQFVTIFEACGEDDTLIFARMRYRGSNFTLNQESQFEFDGQCPSKTNTLPPLIFYVYVDNVDDVFARALSNGCEEMHKPRLEFWGDYKGRFKDPFGYVWEIASRVEA